MINIIIIKIYAQASVTPPLRETQVVHILLSMFLLYVCISLTTYYILALVFSLFIFYFA